MSIFDKKLYFEEKVQMKNGYVSFFSQEPFDSVYFCAESEEHDTEHESSSFSVDRGDLESIHKKIGEVISFMKGDQQ